MTMRWPIVFRATLYFLIASLPIIISSLHDCIWGDQKWTLLYAWWVLLSAFLGGLIALRAFYDGSAERDRVANPTAASPDASTTITQTVTHDPPVKESFTTAPLSLSPTPPPAPVAEPTNPPASLGS